MRSVTRILHKQSVGFIAHFLGAYPTRSGAMIVLLLLSGVAEGIGLVTLLPLLELATGGGEPESDLTVQVHEALQAVGLEPTLLVLLGLIVGAIAMKGALRWFAMRQVGYTVAQVATDLRLRMLRALMDAEWDFFSTTPTGQFANAMSTEARRASWSYKDACSGIGGVIQVMIYLGVVLLINWKVALGAVAVGGSVMFVLRNFVQMGREAGNKQTEVMKSLIGRLTEILPGLKAVKAMGREDRVLPLLERETEGINQAQRQAVLAGETLRSFREPIIVLVIAAGIFLAIEVASASLSALMVAAVLFYRVLTTISNLQSQYQRMAEGESAFWSFKETLERAEVAHEEKVSSGRTPTLDEAIALDSVQFSYPDTPVLRGITARIPAGSFVTLLGPSGAGKTTLVDLVVGLRRPDSGTVLLDGVPLGEIDVTAWRNMVGYVPQQTLLFHDTIFRNVTLSDETLSREEVERALKAAGAWEFVSRLPDQMDEVVGERGAKLSGGQQQRISIARALVGRPKLLILDEATTALDPAIEAEICETLKAIVGEVTIISISHQRPMQRVADRVYELSEGYLNEVTPPIEAVEATEPVGS